MHGILRYPIFAFVLFLTIASGCRILVPQPGIKPAPLAVKAWHPNHWTAKEFPRYCSIFDLPLSLYLKLVSCRQHIVGSYIFLIPWINLFFNWCIQTTYIYCNYWYIRAYESFFGFGLFPLFSILLCPFSCPPMDYVYIVFWISFSYSTSVFGCIFTYSFFLVVALHIIHRYVHMYVILQSISVSILLLCVKYRNLMSI